MPITVKLVQSHLKQINQSKKPNQDSDKCKKCKSIIRDDKECSIQCQWGQQWVHGKCSKLNDEDSKSNPSKQILKDSLPEKQTGLEKKNFQELKQHFVKSRKN